LLYWELPFYARDAGTGKSAAAEEFSLALIGELLGADAALNVRKDSWLRVPRN
jgi:hypothetical protein